MGYVWAYWNVIDESGLVDDAAFFWGRLALTTLPVFYLEVLCC